jgi:hypothetical protein
LGRLMLSFFSARSGTELGVGGVRDLAGCRHVEVLLGIQVPERL